MNLLIVDDEIETLQEIEYYIKKRGGFENCVACTNAEEALEQAEKLPFDMALLDIEMPLMNGLELAERLANLSPTIGLAFITAYNHYAAEAFELNAIDYILKPIREDRLYKALDKLASRSLDRAPNPVDGQELFIQMFGKLTLKTGNNLVKWNRMKSAELFAYLLENQGQWINKEKLSTLLWPDLELSKALVNLQTAMYSLRKTVGAWSGDRVRIEYAGNNYALHIMNIRIDADEFENIIHKIARFRDGVLLKQAVKLYAGDYLEYDGWIWAEPRRELLQKKYIWALMQLRNLSDN